MIKQRKRIDYNRDIITKLSMIVEDHPEQRFGQILYNYVLSTCVSGTGKPHVDDPFYEESSITLSRITKNYNKEQNHENYNNS